jgi:hypothetical protein
MFVDSGQEEKDYELHGDKHSPGCLLLIYSWK